MGLDNDTVKALYDRSVRIPMYWEVDAFFSRATENSIYRKRAIAALGLTADSRVLDAACGTGLNFKIIESYLGESGKLVGVDLSPGVLQVAQKRVKNHRWHNVELVHTNITEFAPTAYPDAVAPFDAALCTLALCIIPDYRAAIDTMLALLKPEGRFSVLGMKRTTRKPYNLLAPVMEWFGKLGGIDWERDVAAYIRSRCTHVSYEECFGGYYYVLSTSKSCVIENAPRSTAHSGQPM
jgi:ubiquinone/menaquinone biosynthesis C-methylase UbiE